MANVFEMVFRAVDKVTAPIRKIKKATKGLSVGLANIGKIAAKGLAVGAFSGLLTLSSFLGVGINQAIAFESAMADVRKVVGDGFQNEQQFKKFGDDILAMSRKIPIAAEGLAEISAEAAAAGIALQDNLRFTEFAAKSAVAFDTTAAAIGESFAKIRNVYQLNQNGLENMSNAVNHLSNNMAAKAPQIIDFINRAGGAAPLLGATAEQMAALGSSLIAVGVVPETAARGINALATRLEVGGKKITKAFGDIGLNYNQFMKGLKADPAGSLEKLFAAIDKSPKGTAALKELVGQDFVDDFLKLAKRTDLLAGSFELLSDKAAMAGSVQAEYEARAATTANNIQLLKNNVNALGVTIGSKALPPINEALTIVNEFLGGLGDGNSAIETTLAALQQGYQDFVSGFSGQWDGIKTKFGEVSKAVSSLGETISSIFSSITGESETFGSTVGKLIGGGIEGGLAIAEAAISGLETAIKTIEAPVRSVVDFISDIVTGIQERFDRVKTAFQDVVNSFEPLGEAIKRVFAAFGGEGGAGALADIISAVLVFSLEALATVLTTIVDTITLVLNKFADFVEFVKTGFKDLDWSALAPDFSDWEFPSFSLWGDEAEEAAKKVKNATQAAKPSAFDVSDPAAIKQAVQMVREIEESQKVIEAQSATVLAAVKHMVTSANATLQSVNWNHHGARMMDTLASGMKSRAHVVVDQIRSTMQEVRDHLPSSPAKVGPLNDIDKLKFGETIARSIKPDAMVKAMRIATQATRAAANDNGFGAVARVNFVQKNKSKTEDLLRNEARVNSAASGRGVAKSTGASSGAGRGDIHIHVGNVKFGGDDGMSQAQFEAMLEQAARKVKRIIDDEDQRLKRRSYG